MALARARDRKSPASLWRRAGFTTDWRCGACGRGRGLRQQRSVRECRDDPREGGHRSHGRAAFADAKLHFPVAEPWRHPPLRRLPVADRAARLCIVIVIAAAIFIGEGLRDAVEVRLQRR